MNTKIINSKQQLLSQLQSVTAEKELINVNSEALASDLRENRKKIHALHYMHGDILNHTIHPQLRYNVFLDNCDDNRLLWRSQI